MSIFRLFKKKSIKFYEVKEKFQKLSYEENGDEKANAFLEELCCEYSKKCPQYSKIFFNVFKDINTKKAISTMRPYIFKENDISFLKVYINRLKKIGEFKLAKQLWINIDEGEFSISKIEIENMLKYPNKKENIERLLSDFPEERESILFNLFAILKDEDSELAIRYGLDYLRIKPNDFKLFFILKKRIKHVDLNEEELKFFDKLNININYFNKVKKILINNSKYDFKKNLNIAINKLSDEKLIERLLEEVFYEVSDKENLHKIAFKVLKDTKYDELALKIAKKYLEETPSDKKFKRSLQKFKIQNNEDYKKEFEEKMLNIIDNNLDKKLTNKKFILFLNLLKDFDDLEFDFIIRQLQNQYHTKSSDINKIIFSELKDYNIHRAIRYGKKYLESNMDCKFIKVFLKRLERLDDLENMYHYANEASKYCDDYEIHYIKFKFDLSKDIENLAKIKILEQQSFIKELEKKYYEYLAFLYRELFSFYKNKDYILAEGYAKKSLEINYNEYIIKDLYDLYIYYGDLVKANEILPKKFNLATLATKKANISSLLDLYNNGFDLKLEKIEGYTPKKNKILYILHNRLPYNSGGYATRSHGLLTGVFEHGWDIHGVSRLGYPYDKIKNIETQEIDIIDNIPYHILLKEDIGLGTLPLKKYLEEYAYSLLDFAKKEKPYIIHAASNYMNGVVANYVARCLGIKSVYEVRGLWELTRISRQPEWENTEYYNLMAKMEAEAAQGADYVFTLTNALKDEMIRRGVDGDKIFILPNGVMTERFSPLKKNVELADKLNIENKIVIGFIGSFVQYEGLEYIVDAIEILVNKGITNIIALMVGDGTVWQDIVSRVQDKKLEKYFIFTGRIPHDEVEDYYSLVDIAPLPRKGLPVCEMVSPLKPFEAMAMEKVVLSSNVAALAEIVEDGFNGMLFEKDNVKDLADKIEILANDQVLRRNIGKQARKWVLENRDWKNISEILHQSYKKMKEI